MSFLYFGMFENYFEFLISFAFTFALVFGVLTASRVFGEHKYPYVRNVNILVALSLALFASLYEPYISFIKLWFPYLIGFFIFVFILVILKNLFGGVSKEKAASWEMAISIVILFLVFLALSPSLTYYKDISVLLGVALVILILIIGSRLHWPGEKE
jgi:hypothetical protein